jgi:hypothetical protein
MVHTVGEGRTQSSSEAGKDDGGRDIGGGSMQMNRRVLAASREVRPFGEQPWYLARLLRSSGPLRWFRAVATTLATVTLTACHESPNGLDLNSNLVGGVTYRTTSLIIAESFPVQIGVTVELVNGSGTPQSVTFPDGCVVLMRVYDGGTDLVWDMGDAVGFTQTLVEVELAPGASEIFQSGLVSAATILGDSLSNGEYRITAYLRPGEVVELNAGTADLAIP